MTLATAVRDTIYELTRETPLELTEVPAELTAPAGLEQGTSSPFVDVLVHQLDRENSPSTFPIQVGQVIRAQRSYRHSEEWFIISAGQRYYFTGTRVCLTPRVGALYRVYTPDHSSFLCRRNENGRWDIVRGAGMNPHPYESDALATEPVLWWEVVDETPAHAEVATAEPFNEPEPEPEPEPAFDAEAFFATAISNGLVASPVEVVEPGNFVDGDMYVYATDASERHVYVAMKMMGSDTPEPMGIYNTYYGYMDNVSTSHHVPDGSRWAKMVPPADSIDAQHSLRTRRIVVNGLNEKTIAQRKRNYELNTALNELARENGWCGEYERVMARIGMRGRDTKYTGVVRDIRVSFAVRRVDGSEVFNSLAQTLGVPEVRSASVEVTIPELVVEVEARSGSASDYMGTENIRQAYVQMLEATGAKVHESLRIEDMYVSNYNTTETNWEVSGGDDIDVSDLPEVPEEAPVEAPLAG